MSYEYMTGMGNPPKGDENGSVSVDNQQDGWLNEEEAAANVAAFRRDETRNMINAFVAQIERARSGDQSAMRELQDMVTHHDTQESLVSCREFMAGRTETPPIDADLYREYCEAINLAIQVAEGNDPQRQRNTMIAIGAGAGALVVAGVAVWLLKR